MLLEMNHPVVRIQVDQIDRKQHADRMNPVRRREPDAIVGFQADSSQCSAQAHQQSVRGNHAKSEERLAGSIEYAISSFHAWFRPAHAADLRASI